MLTADFAGFRVDLNDPPLNAVADHQPRELAGAEKIAHQIDLQRAVEIPQREVANKRRLGDPGAVHQQVDARKNLIHPVGQGGDAGLAGGVGAEAVRHTFAILSVNLLGDAAGFFALNIDHRHAVALGGQPAAQKLS